MPCEQQPNTDPGYHPECHLCGTKNESSTLGSAIGHLPSLLASSMSLPFAASAIF